MTPTNDAVTLLTAELAKQGKVPTAADISAVMQIGFHPSKYLIYVNGTASTTAVNRLMAIVRARAASRRNPDALVEVEYQPTGERAAADDDGSFVHSEDRYHWATADD